MGLNDVEVFTLEAKLVAIKAEVKVEIHDFFFFEWGEGETRFLGIELDEVLTSFSENGIHFSRAESSSEVSESKEKHDSRSEDAIKFEGSTWDGVSDEERFSFNSEEEKDESS